jgi:hypothetical protein
MSLEYGDETEKFQELLDEIYQATQNNLPRLAMMGVRALLEQVMIAKVGDRGTFVEHLKGFHESGYISVVQFDVLTKVLDAGSAVMHRGFAPEKKHLDTAIDVMEGILAALYVHNQDVKALEVPERPTRRSARSER